MDLSEGARRFATRRAPPELPCLPPEEARGTDVALRDLLEEGEGRSRHFGHLCTCCRRRR